MGLTYPKNTLPFTRQRRVAAFGSKLMGTKPMQGGLVDTESGMVRVLSGHSSAFIVPISDDSVVLIDAGMEDDAGNICAVLDQMQYEPGDVTAIFVTHGHIDHAAGAHVFKDATIYAHEHEHAFLTGEATGDGTVGRLTGKLAKAHAVSTMKLAQITDFQKVTTGKVVVQAYAMPGHTQGSMAYRIGNVLCVGDGVFFNGRGEVFMPPSMITKDEEQARQSIDLLVESVRGDDIKVVATAHSGDGDMAALRSFQDDI